MDTFIAYWAILLGGIAFAFIMPHVADKVIKHFEGKK